jgi:hypothetical protein
MAVDVHQRRERRIVQSHRHADAEHGPRRKQHRGILHEAQQHEAAGEHEVGQHQRIAPAGAVDSTAHNGACGRHYQ